MKEDGQTMSRKRGILSAPDHAFHQALRGVAVKLRSITLRDKIAPDIQQPRAALYGMTFRTSHCGKKAIDHHTHGVKDYRVSLLQVDSQVILPAKKRCSLIPP